MVFRNLLNVCRDRGARLVAPNRRHYPGSTPLTDRELHLVKNGGSEEEKDAYFQKRGDEIAIFIHNLIDLIDTEQKYNIPKVSADEKRGSIVILGWSLGCVFALAALAAIHKLPEEVRGRLSTRIREFVLYGTYFCTYRYMLFIKCVAA